MRRPRRAADALDAAGDQFRLARSAAAAVRSTEYRPQQFPDSPLSNRFRLNWQPFMSAELPGGSAQKVHCADRLLFRFCWQFRVKPLMQR